MSNGFGGSIGDVSSVYTRVVPITNDQFKALPTTPLTITAATQVLNYVGFPSLVPIAVGATLILNNVAGAYVADSDAYLVIAMGSDWSSNLTQKSTPNMLTNAGVHQCTFASKMLAPVATTPTTAIMEADSFIELNDAVKDNAIVLAASNTGDFTGGHASNYAWIILTYQLLRIA